MGIVSFSLDDWDDDDDDDDVMMMDVVINDSSV